MLITLGVGVNILFRTLYWIWIWNQRVLTTLTCKLQPSIGKKGAQCKFSSVLLLFLLFKNSTVTGFLYPRQWFSTCFNQMPPYLSWNCAESWSSVSVHSEFPNTYLKPKALSGWKWTHCSSESETNAVALWTTLWLRYSAHWVEYAFCIDFCFMWAMTTLQAK